VAARAEEEAVEADALSGAAHAPAPEPSRRALLKAAVVSATLAGATGARAAPAPTEGRADLKLGLTTYSTRELSLDQTIALMQRLALRHVSLKDVHLALDSSPDERRAVARKLKDAGLTLLGCGVIAMSSEAEMRRAFDYARDLGAATIVASPHPTSLGALDSLVAKYDIRIAIHNHGPDDQHYPTPESVARAVADHDARIGLCIDIGHTERAGVRAAQAVAAYGSRLYELHIKDLDRAAPDAKAVELGRGVIDLVAVLRALAAAKFTGHVALEFEKDPQDPLPGIAESIGYLRGALAALA
jgi:sugar phosphate isomerase/epimerase